MIVKNPLLDKRANCGVIYMKHWILLMSEQTPTKFIYTFGYGHLL